MADGVWTLLSSSRWRARPAGRVPTTCVFYHLPSQSALMAVNTPLYSEQNLNSMARKAIKSIYVLLLQKATWSTASGWCMDESVRKVTVELLELLKASVAADGKIMSFQSFWHDFITEKCYPDTRSHNTITPQPPTTFCSLNCIMRGITEMLPPNLDVHHTSSLLSFLLSFVFC